jgi:hypothetical protein
MRIIAAAILTAALATPGFAQSPSLGSTLTPNLGSDINHPKTVEELKRQQEIENSYKSGLSKIPDQKASTDPWGNVRADPKATQAKVPSTQKKTSP